MDLVFLSDDSRYPLGYFAVWEACSEHLNYFEQYYTAMEQNSINRGGSPKKLLLERGLSYEGNRILPEVPDLMSYLLGFLLIWLLYTGYQSVLRVFSGVSPVTNSIRTSIDENISKGKGLVAAAVDKDSHRIPADTQRAQLSSRKSIKVVKEKGWFASFIDYLNEGVDELSAEAGQGIRSWVDGTDSGPIEENPIEEDPILPLDESDQLVPF
jgi:hypothetical protein